METSSEGCPLYTRSCSVHTEVAFDIIHCKILPETGLPRLRRKLECTPPTVLNFRSEWGLGCDVSMILAVFPLKNHYKRKANDAKHMVESSPCTSSTGLNKQWSKAPFRCIPEGRTQGRVSRLLYKKRRWVVQPVRQIAMGTFRGSLPQKSKTVL